MLPKTSLERLQNFKIPGFIDALLLQMQSTLYLDLSFEDRLTLLIDTEHTRRLDVRTKRMLKEARLPNSAALEEVNFAVQRGLNKKLLIEIAQGNWLSSGTNVFITGPTGVGETFIGSVIAHSIIVRGLSVRCQRTNHWLSDLQSYAERRRLQQSLGNMCKLSLLIFDEWLLDPISQTDARLLLELLESRYHKHSCMFITQLKVEEWHARFSDPALADAILDRIVHNSVRIPLDGPSMRKILAPNNTSIQE